MEVIAAARVEHVSWMESLLWRAACCDKEQRDALGSGNNGGNLGGGDGLGSDSGSVGHRHCGQRDLAVEWVNGCLFHGLDIEYSVGAGVL